tara:strand:+ start:1286 stop:1546 length:261 start_codon:yes stop_codon:yes gene_type:complete
MSERKRDLGREADKVFKDIRDELSSLLDSTIENSEKVPSPDLWADFAGGMFCSMETLLNYIEQLESLAAAGDGLLMQDVYDSLPKH